MPNLKQNTGANGYQFDEDVREQISSVEDETETALPVSGEDASADNEEPPVNEPENKMEEGEDLIEKPNISTKRRVASKFKFISFLNLGNMLKKDCETEYGVSKLVINYAIAFVLIALIGLLYSLKLPYVLVLCLTYFVFGPSLIYYRIRKKYEQQKFASSIRYIEQMIYSFTRKAKILTALEETRMLMSGKIVEAIDYAITVLRHGKSKDNIYADALKSIEDFFPCVRIKNLHEFLIEVERVGGRHTTALEIMLDDAREWDVRVNNFRQERAVKAVSLLISIFMSLGVCFFMTNILPDDMGGNITGYLLYQVLTTVSLIVMFLIYVFASQKLTRSWVNDDLGEDEDQILADYKKVKEYYADPKGKIKPVLAKTRMKTALEKAFPRWVMKLSLLASTKPIAVAMVESVDEAPAVIRCELAKMAAAIEENPTSIKPYVDFYEEFAEDVPQIRSLMMMIYSLSEADSSQADKHVLSIVKRNHVLQATAEKIENDDKMALFTLYTTLPMLLACVIMILDVAMIVLNMLNTVL